MSIQRAITAALLEIGGSVTEPLIAALSDDHDVIRITAAEVLGDLGDSRAEEPLIKMLSQVERGPPDHRHNLQKAAASALGQIGDPRAVKSLVEALIQPRDVDVRISAASALGKIGTRRR